MENFVVVFIRVYPGYHVHGGVCTACCYDGHTGGGFDITVNSLFFYLDVNTVSQFTCAKSV